MQQTSWTLVNTRLTVVIEGSDDLTINSVRRNAIVRGYDVDARGTLTRLLVELETPLYYCGHYAAPSPHGVTEHEIAWLVAVAGPGMPSPSRLLLFCAWSARIIDAPSFAASTGLQPFGVARLRRRLRR